jgi:hypothetical protein
MIKRVGILIGLFLLFLIFVSGLSYAKSQLEGPTCGDGVCERSEKECSSSAVICEEDDPSLCAATSDCGPHYCPDDCRASEGELDKCRSSCKSTCYDEECRSKCINECKSNYGSERDYLECAPCGDGCIPKDMLPVASCLQQTKDFECGARDGTCVILEEDIFEEYEDAELKASAGTTPNHAFYFVDKFFDQFGDQLQVREERIAEIKAMVEAGEYESAKKALKEYMELAEKLKHEVGPGERDEAVRSAAAIRNVIRSIKDSIPEDERDDFLEIIEKERSIATAAEIAGKIDNLCRELSELDPELFYENCRIGDEGPKWQKEMYKDLTKEQKQEAKKFANIMKQCFKTSGQDCKCEEIPYEDFSAACSDAASLATACDVEEDEGACDKLDELDMPVLPPHLQDIFDEMDGMDKERYDMHMPKECQEAGATSPDECGRIMVEMHSPPECKEALLAANTKTEREGREICDAIMMNKHAPECAEEGISDPEECKDFMWNMDRRPKECQENKIHDFRDCKKFLAEGGTGSKGPGPRMDFSCRDIDDAMERLECYDGASSSVGGYKDVQSSDYSGPCMTPDDWDEKKSECRSLYGENAGDEPIMGSSGSGYECVIDITCVDFGQDFETVEGPSGDWEDWGDGSASCDDCASECPDASRTDCVDGQCECYYDGAEYDEPEEDSSEENEEAESSESDGGGEGGNEITGEFFLDYWFN